MLLVELSGYRFKDYLQTELAVGGTECEDVKRTELDPLAEFCDNSGGLCFA
jgi:hypothetical protein